MARDRRCTSTGVLSWLRHTHDDSKAGTADNVAAVLCWIKNPLRCAKEILSFVFSDVDAPPRSSSNEAYNGRTK